MLYLIIALEGISEKNLVEAFTERIVGQTPGGYRRIEIVPFSIDGNHGYTRLVEIANSFVEKYKNDPENCIEPDDVIEKWLVFDYDDIESKKITLEVLRKQAAEEGFACVVSKPNFEFFVLAVLGGYEYAKKVNPANYVGEINRIIDKINEQDFREKEWFTNAMKIVPYSKRSFQNKDCFLYILQNHPELFSFDEITLKMTETSGGCYSEVPILLKRIFELIKDEGL